MPNRFFAASLLVLFGNLGAVNASGPFNLDVLRRDGYGAADLSLRDNTFFVPVAVNGQKVRLILDTGFSGGIGLDNNMANVKIATEAKTQHGQGISGKSVEVHRGTAQTVALGNVQLTDVPVQVGGFTALSKAHADTFSNRFDFDTSVGTAAAGEGLMGRDFLHTNHAVIDLANKALYLRPPGKGRAVNLSGALTGAGMGSASITNGNMVDVEINGVTGKMVIDTGAFVSLIDPRFVAKAKVKGGWGLRGAELTDIAGAKSRVDFTRLSNVKIGGVSVRGATVTVVNFAGYVSSGGKEVGLLGLDFLGQNWSIIDFGQNKLYFAKAK